ncbi:MAG: hypothetical protein DCO96_13170 [Fluviicola sp. XM-24bin1]|nr:MAG: hypothetical protein DCO96_13170 [Fluviicola sp. XM-24bin1]
MTIARKIQLNQSRMQGLLIALRISFAYYIAKFIFELFRYSIFTRVLNSVPIDPRQLVLVEFIEIVTWWFQFAFIVLCGIFMILWIHRAYTNLGQFERLKYSENMAVLGWFLPVFS